MTSYYSGTTLASLRQENRPWNLSSTSDAASKVLTGMGELKLMYSDQWDQATNSGPDRDMRLYAEGGNPGGDIIILRNGRIGAGSYGNVYKAVAVQKDGTQIPVVVKLGKKLYGGMTKSFRNELVVFWEQSSDPTCSQHLICMYGAFTTNLNMTSISGQRYEALVLEKMDGDLERLARLVKSSGVSVDSMLYMLVYIGLHMTYDIYMLHGAGYYHNDVKPANFLYRWDPVSRKYRIKIADLGLVCNKEPSMSQRFAERAAMPNVFDISEILAKMPERMSCYALGTPNYMSPEMKELQERYVIKGATLEELRTLKANYNLTAPIVADVGRRDTKYLMRQPVTAELDVFEYNDYFGIVMTLKTLAKLMMIKSADPALACYNGTPVFQALVAPMDGLSLLEAYNKAVLYFIRTNVQLPAILPDSSLNAFEVGPMAEPQHPELSSETEEV